MRKFLARRISSLLVAAILFSTVFDNMWAAHIVYANVEENTDKEDIKQADTSMELLDDEAFTDLLTIDEEDPTGSNLSSDTLIEAESGNDTIFNEDLPVTDDALEGDDTLCEVANDKAPADASWLRFYNTTSDNTTRKITVKSMKNDITSDFQITIPAKTDIGGVTYTTVLDNSGNGQKSLWYSQREVIRSIKIEKGVEAAGNCSYLFSGLKKLTSLDVSGLDTSKVTDMSYMFSEDDALTGLDLSGFDTSKVTNMAGMFRSCDALKTVNLSNFNTSSVTDMNNMFYYDLALESLDLSGFDTSKVINMRYMMGDCRSLKEVDLSKFNTSSVTNINSMFYNCKSLIELDVSSFDTSKVTDFAWTFDGLNSNVSTLDLRSLVVNKNLQDGKKSSMFPAGIVKLYLNKDTVTHFNFNNYKSLTDIFYAGSEQEWNGLGNTVPDTVKVTYNFSGEVRKMSVTPDKGKAETSNWFDKYYNTYISKKFKKLVILSSKGKFKEEGKKQVVIPAQTKINGEVYTTVLEGGKALWESEQGGIESIEIGDGTETTTDCSNLFANLSGLKSINIGGLDMSNVVDMSNMFSKDYSLTKVDLSGLNTAEVRKMNRMFYNCTNLENINLTKLTTNAVTDMSYMFYYNESLLSLDLTGMNTGKVRNMSHMFDNCSALKEVDLTNFNTSSVTNMSYMFNSCSALMDLDVGSFNTEKVENYTYMFSYLSPNVSTLNLLNFSIVAKSGNPPKYEGMLPTNVVDLYLSRSTVGNYNFSGFSRLANIYYKGDQTAWDALSNTVPAGVHVICNFTGTVEPKMKITEDKGHAVTFNWYDGYYKYFISTKYKKLVLLSSTGKQNAEAKSGTGIGMPELIVIPGQTNIDGTVYTTLLDNTGNRKSLWYEDRDIVQKVIIEEYVETTSDCSYLFSGLNNLKEIDLQGFDTSGITDMSYMFNGCNVLGSADLSGFKTGKVRNMSYMFNNCYALKEIQMDPVNFNTTMVTNMDHMFANCTGLTAIDLSGFATSNVTNFNYMFYRLSPDIDVLDLRSFNMSNTAPSSCIFDYSEIVYLYLSKNTVRNYDFTRNESLTDIYYIGTEAEWTTLNNNTGNGDKPKVHYNSDPDTPSVSRCKVSFDAVGGTAAKTSKTVTYERPYGELPDAEKGGFDFEGWFTEKEGGTQVFPTTMVTTTANHTLYARWTVLASDITVTPGSVTLKMGSEETKLLTVVVKPDTATNKNVIWSSSNPEVAMVDANGKVTALKEGKAIITASAERGNASGECEVTVLTNEEDEETRKNRLMNSGLDGTCITVKKLDITKAFGTVSESNIRYVITNKNQRKLASVSRKKGLLTAKKPGLVHVTLQKKDGSTWKDLKTVSFDIVVPKADKLNYGKVYYTGQTRDLNTLLKGNDVLHPNSWETKVNSSVATIDSKGVLTAGTKNGAATVYAVYGSGKYARKVKITVKINHAKVDISDKFTPVTGKIRYKILNKDHKKIASVNAKGFLTVKKNKSGAVTVTRQVKNGTSWVNAGEITFQVANPMTGPIQNK